MARKTVNRRNFIGGLFAAASALYLPYEPSRVYSFASTQYVRAAELSREMLGFGLIQPRLVERQTQEILRWGSAAKDQIRMALPEFATSRCCRMLGAGPFIPETMMDFVVREESVTGMLAYGPEHSNDQEWLNVIARTSRYNMIRFQHD